MASVTVRVTVPDVRGIRGDVRLIARENHRAALEATEIASKKAQRHIQAKMRSVGLGGLSNAVGQTSALKKRQTEFTRNPYGVIFARGEGDAYDMGRSAGALDAYANGAVIRPRNGNWLAVPTKAAPRFVRSGGKRRRLTPSTWAAAGLNSKIGKLIFRQVRPNLALLVVRGVSLSPKTGQAKMLGKSGRSRTRIVPKKDVVVFVLIKQTVRAKRFDKDDIVRFYADRLPDYLARLIAGYNRAAQ